MTLSPAHAPTDTGTRPTDWTASAWLAGINVQDVVSQVLLTSLAHGDSELSALRALGRAKHVQRGVAAKLRAGNIVQRLAALIAPRLAELSQMAAVTGDELHSKFAAESDAFVLSYGGLSDFFGGLEQKIGVPNPQLQETTMVEHTEFKDSLEPFTAHNYGTRTTSRLEYEFCASPEVSDVAWPAETKLLARGGNASHCRKTLPLTELRRRLDEKNSRLAEVFTLGLPPTLEGSCVVCVSLGCE